MKKTIALLLTAVATIFLLSSCNSSEVIVITDRLFITQLHDISQERNHYMGRTIQIEGRNHFVDFSGNDLYFIVRYTRGCCGEQNLTGFQVYFDDHPIPDNGAWVRVVGTLEICDVTPHGLRLRVTSLRNISPGQDWVEN